MDKKEEDNLLSHSYDGIQEYDNNLPKWWTQLFWVTIIFGVVYLGYYQFGPGLSQEMTLALEMAEVEKLQAALPKSEISEADLLALVSNAEVVKKGSETYMTKCLACHGPQGQGLVGPNLTDNHWIHGSSLTDNRRIVVEGVPAKGMLPWKGLLTDDEINAVVVFVRTLQGTDPPNPKSPEGTPDA